MKLALLLLVAVSAFGEGPKTVNTGWHVSQAEQSLEDYVRDIFGGDVEWQFYSGGNPVFTVKDGTLICNDGECVVVRLNGPGRLAADPALDKSLLAAVRIYRYKLARGEAPVDAAASTCADGEAQVGDACDVHDSGLLFMLGSTR